MTLAQLIVKLAADTSDFRSKMTGAGKHWRRVGTQMSSLGSKLSVGVSLPLAIMGTAVAKAAIDFETAFAGVRKTVDATEKEFAVLSAGIRKMAQEIPAGTTEIANVTEAAGQLGIEKKNLLSFTRTMIDLGNTTNLSAQDAAMALARLANITQMSQDQFENLGSTIVALGNATATTEAEIVEMGLRISAAGKQVGMSIPQVMGMAAALSSVGINAQAGGTAISKVMIKIANSVASNTKELKTFAKVADMSITEFKDLFQNDAAGAIVSVITGLNRMSKSGENVFAILEELGFSEIRVRDALLRASGAGDLFSRSMELGTKAWKENSALTEEAQKRYDTLASQFKILKGQVLEIAITLGEALMPMIRNLIETSKPAVEQLRKMAEWFKNLSPKVQTLVVGMVALLAALGPIVFIVGKVVAGFGALAGVGAILMGPVGFFALLAIALVVIYDSLRGLQRANVAYTNSIIEQQKWIDESISKYEDMAAALQKVAGGTELAARMTRAFDRVQKGIKLGEIAAKGTAQEVRDALEEITGMKVTPLQNLFQNTREALKRLATEEINNGHKLLALYKKQGIAKLQSAAPGAKPTAPGAPPGLPSAEPIDTSGLDAFNVAHHKAMNEAYEHSLFLLDKEKAAYLKEGMDKAKVDEWFVARKGKIDEDYYKKVFAALDAEFGAIDKQVKKEAQLSEEAARGIEEEKRRVVLAGITDRYQLQAEQAKNQAANDIVAFQGTEDQKAEYATARNQRLQMDLTRIKEAGEAARLREEVRVAKEEEMIVAEKAAAFQKGILRNEELTKSAQVKELERYKDMHLVKFPEIYAQMTETIKGLQANMDVTIQDKWRTTLDQIKVMFGEWGETVAGFVDTMTNTFASGVGNILVGLQTAGDFFTGLFDTLRQSVAQVISDIVKNWIMGMLEQKLASVSKGIAEIGMATAAAMAWAIASQAMLGPFGLISGAALALEYGALIATTTAPMMASVAMAEGGIVTGPTMALIGEAGPEAVIPLGKGAGMGDIIFNHYGDIKTDMDVQLLKKDLAETIEGAVRGS